MRPVVRDDGPTPAGPLDRIINADPNGYSTNYTNVNGVVHFRMAFINGAASQPTISVTVDAVPATLIGMDVDSTVGAAGVVAFYVTGLAPGAHTIAIAVSAGSLTKAALRVGELVSQTSINGPWGSVQTNPSYYIEVDGGTTVGVGQVGTIFAYNTENAFDISLSYPDTEQWSSSMPGLAFRFGTAPRPSGEPGWGGFVAYSAGGVLANGAGLVYEIAGGVLP